MASGLVWSPEAIEDIESIASYIERDPAFRERFAYSYRIIYRLEPERVLIAAVIHGRRLLEPLIQRMESAQKSNP